MSLGENGFERKTRSTRKREFLYETNRVVQLAELVALMASHAPALGANGRRLQFAIEIMLRIHFLQQWSTCGTWRSVPNCLGALRACLGALRADPSRIGARRGRPCADFPSVRTIALPEMFFALQHFQYQS